MTTRHTILGLLAAIGSIASVAPAAPIAISISGSGAAGGLVGTTADGSRTVRYNRIGDNSSVGDLTDTDGASTGIAVTWVAGKTGANNNVAAGYVNGPAAAMFPEDATRSFLAVSTPRTNFMRWRLDGLDLDSVYDFALFASREGTGDASSSFTILGQNTLAGSINGRGNTGTLLHLNDARPDPFGSLEIVLRFGATNTSTFAYFNALQVTERSLSLVPEPATVALLVGPVVLLARRRRVSAA
jgi:hypothetical protein